MLVADIVTANVASFVPESPSVTVTSLIESAGNPVHPTSSTHPVSLPELTASSFVYFHCATWVPAGMATLRFSHAVWPEISVTAGTPSTLNQRKSQSSSEETFHQKLSVPGPVRVVCKDVIWLLAISPPCPAVASAW